MQDLYKKIQNLHLDSIQSVHNLYTHIFNCEKYTTDPAKNSDHKVRFREEKYLPLFT